MARKPWLLQVLTWTSSIPIVFSSAVGLGNDITSVVPSCAQSCLQSFISSNYPTANCGADFTLPCLCSTQSISGFTVGEGALQCLLGNAQIGRCDEQDVDGSTPSSVFNICNGQKNPLPNTHPVITATLVIPLSGEPTLLPPSPKTTSEVSSTSSRITQSVSSTSSQTTGSVLATSPQTTQSISASPSQTTQSISSQTTQLASSTSPQITEPVSVTSSQTTQSVSVTSSQTTQSASSTLTSVGATLGIITTSPSSSMTTNVATSLPTPTPTAEPSSRKELAPAQIAGISVGVAGAIGLAAGAIFLARYMRRRRYPDSDVEKGFYQNGNSTASFEPLGSRASRIFHISPPVLEASRYRPEFGPRPAPPALREAPSSEARPQSANMDKNTIGLAISRPRSFLRPKSFLQLHSPALSTPREVEEPVERKNSRLLPPRPDLTLDIPPKAATTAAPSSQTPPTTDRVSTMTNMTAFADLDSAAAEGAQVWRPPPSDPLSATTLYFADKHGNWVLSNNHRRSRNAQVMQAAGPHTSMPSTKSPTEKQKEVANTDGITATSSTLPTASQPAFLSQSPTRWQNSQYSSLYSQTTAPQQTGRKNSSGSNRVLMSQRGSGAPTIGRSDSKNSVTTIQSTSTGWNDNWVTYDESDVARLSQLSPVAESPNPPTGRPRVNYPRIPGRLDGATIRFVPPPKRPNFEDLTSGQRSSTLGVLYPAQESPPVYPPPLNPRRHERRLAPIPRNGSGFTPEPPEPPNVEVFPLQNYSHANETSRPGSNPSVYSQHQNTYEMPRRRPVPPSNTRRVSFAEKRSLTPPQPGDTHYDPPYMASQRPGPDTSFGAAGPATSSLLAKRVGRDKAATLALGPNRTKPQHWRREDGGGRPLGPDATPLGSSGTLPQTPMWQPRLTPTRQGDDLFLDVK